MAQLDFQLPGSSHAGWIAGTDEAGRGPLAGDVVAAAVILDPGLPIKGLNDSKRLNQAQREQCYRQIIAQAVAVSVARANVQEIDELNILQASLLAMRRAVESLIPQAEFIYVDGNHCPKWRYDSAAIVKGDSRLQCVAAASIIAKVTRDREMCRMDQQFPGYGFAHHKGYPTRNHLQALASLGPCSIHRRSFRPVAQWLAQ